MIEYSLECDQGGAYIQIVTDTPLGLGNQTFHVCVADDRSEDADVLTDTPQVGTVEYTADPITQEIVDGPVELVDSETRQVFEVFAIGGAATTHSDLTSVAVRGAIGTLAGNVVTWDNSVPFQSLTLGCTDCFGSPVICSLAAPPGGWPRCEPDIPLDRPLPLWGITDGPLGRATGFAADNLTPEDPTDDILASMDAQATTYSTWIGVETRRTFVPESGEGALLASALAGLLGIRRLRSSRTKFRSVPKPLGATLAQGEKHAMESMAHGAQCGVHGKSGGGPRSA